MLQRHMQLLQTVIGNVSPLSCAYSQMVLVEQEENRQVREDHPTQPVTMFFTHGCDQWRYNNLLQDDTAAVFIEENGAPPGLRDRDIIVHPLWLLL